MHARPLTSCPTQSNPVDSSLPGSSVHGILQARIPEWEAMPSSRYLSHPGIKLAPLLSPALADRFFTISTTRGSQTKASIHQFSFPSDSFKLREFDYVYIKWNYFVTKKGGGWWCFPGSSDSKTSACQCRRPRLDPWIWKTPWRRK